MKSYHRLLYAAAGQLARGAAAVAPPRQSKIWSALRARKGIRARYQGWGEAERDRTRELLWMHAPSVGEGLQARPVLLTARERRPDLQLAFSFFSPSAARFAAELPVDFADYLPFDTPGDVRVALQSLQPAALVFSKLDVWPILTREASRLGVSLGLISATLAAASSRRSGWATGLLRQAYASLDSVGAVDAADADRLVELGVRPGVITVTGDTRFDQVWERARSVDMSGALLGPLASDRPTLVAGSTWPADEAELLPAWAALASREAGVRLIVAPHEPTPGHLEPVEQWAANAGLRLARLGTDGAATADVILVDRTGVLGQLYALADVAFVGGGFHSAGLHSVLEPAAFGAPVLFGPRHQASREAGLLIHRGGGRSVEDSAELEDALRTWLLSPAYREPVGTAARATVRAGLGAAERSWALVKALLGR